MKAKNELKILELIESIPIPPQLPVLFTYTDKGKTEIPYNLIEYFKTLNIELNKTEPTDKIRDLLRQYEIEPFEIVFNIVPAKTKQNSK